MDGRKEGRTFWINARKERGNYFKANRAMMGLKDISDGWNWNCGGAEGPKDGAGTGMEVGNR